LTYVPAWYRDGSLWRSGACERATGEHAPRTPPASTAMETPPHMLRWRDAPRGEVIDEPLGSRRVAGLEPTGRRVTITISNVEADRPARQLLRENVQSGKRWTCSLTTSCRRAPWRTVAGVRPFHWSDTRDGCARTIFLQRPTSTVQSPNDVFDW